MTNRNATAYMRLPLVLPNASEMTTLRLRVKYDDGFVAWINGQQIAARNAPGSPTWN